jgi:uncharacterized protein YndB with AHSA1/START domain
MAENRTHVPASVSQIWSVISDPDTYADWVVGAKEVRGVEGRWPHVGAKLFHTVGGPGIDLRDHTEVLEVDPCVHIKLRGNFRPLGIAVITLDLEPNDDGTDIVMHEQVVGGFAAALRQRINDVFLRSRNAETLRRLGDRATGQRQES